MRERKRVAKTKMTIPMKMEPDRLKTSRERGGDPVLQVKGQDFQGMTRSSGAAQGFQALIH